MKKLVSYSNCQGGGVLTFLRKTRMADWTMLQMNNWQYLVTPQELDPEDLIKQSSDCDVFLYQPTPALRYGMLSTEEMIATVVPKTAVKISFSYLFNTGFLPIIKSSPGVAGWITGKEVHDLCRMKEFGRLRTLYDQSQLRFDCIARFAACLAEQSHREQTCDIKVSQFILDQFQSRRLFLTQNHPTSAIFAEIASQIELLVYGQAGWLHVKDENEAQMNGTQPIHHSVVRELGLRYPSNPEGLMHYREQLDAMIKEYQAL